MPDTSDLEGSRGRRRCLDLKGTIVGLKIIDYVSFDIVGTGRPGTGTARLGIPLPRASDAAIAERDRSTSFPSGQRYPCKAP